MFSHEALKLAVGRDTVEHAKAHHKSTSLIHKWTEPATDYTDSGAFSPLDRLEILVDTSLRLGNVSRSHSLAPISFLAARFHLAYASTRIGPDRKSPPKLIYYLLQPKPQLACARQQSTWLKQHHNEQDHRHIYPLETFFFLACFLASSSRVACRRARKLPAGGAGAGAGSVAPEKKAANSSRMIWRIRSSGEFMRLP